MPRSPPMGMIANLHRGPAAQIRALLTAPKTIHAYLAEHGDDHIANLSLQKAWHGMHFLFTGTGRGGTPPLDFLLGGGTPVGKEDVGYGPARAFSTDQLRAIVAALHELDPAALRARYDAARMTELEIYPAVIWAREEERNDEWLLRMVQKATQFLHVAAANDQWLLVYAT